MKSDNLKETFIPRYLILPVGKERCGMCADSVISPLSKQLILYQFISKV